jgi:DNA-binding response OmpR family regulator
MAATRWLAPLVLVVDDDAATRYYLTEALQLEGYEVRTARRGAEALRALVACHPQLVLLDLPMPIATGACFLQTVLQRGLTVPICLMSDAANAPAVATEFGIRWRLAKPFHLADLVAVVQLACA